MYQNATPGICANRIIRPLVAIGRDSYVARSFDGGRSWMALGAVLPTSGSPFWAASCWSSKYQRLVALNRGGNTSTFSLDWGSTWSAQSANLPSSVDWRTVANDTLRNRLIAIVYGANATAYSDDGGVTWTARNSVLTASANWLCSAYDPVHDRTVVVNDASVSNYSTDGGETFSAGGTLPQQSTGATWRNLTYDRVTGRLLCISSTTQDVTYSTNGGTTWTNIPGALGGTGYWPVASAQHENRLILLTSSGTPTLVSTNGGATWSQTGVAVMPSSNVWYRLHWVG